jgi:endoglucanase
MPAVRPVDPEHIVFLEGNTFSMDFSGFDKVFPNTVYAVDDYCGFSFPNRIRRYHGQKD